MQHDLPQNHEADVPHDVSSDPDDGEKAAFEEHTQKGVVRFKPCNHGLHYLDLAEHGNAEILCNQMVPTVCERFQGYLRQEVLGAIKARKLQRMLGGPSLADYKGMVHAKMIEDNPVEPSL